MPKSYQQKKMLQLEVRTATNGNVIRLADVSHQRGPSYLADMLNMMDAADGLPLYPSCSHSIFTRAIRLLQSQYPQVFSGTLVAVYPLALAEYRNRHAFLHI
jgi:hypothetical protein